MVQKFVRLARVNYANAGLTETEAIAAVNRAKCRIPSKKEFDTMLLDPDFLKGRQQYAWTGTFVAFGGVGKRLGDVIITPRTLCTFEVPKEYQNEKNAILIMQHGFLDNGEPVFNFKVDGKRIFVDVPDKSRIEFLPNFPSADGWYVADEKFGVPIEGKVAAKTQGACYLRREIPPNEEGYAGLVQQGFIRKMRTTFLTIPFLGERCGVLAFDNGTVKTKGGFYEGCLLW